ncbi:MAG: hypothetical protein OXC13_07790 [Caldilineaceae bacterium]|nr:hypothetical protein [Caldilineaceae bacterium]
MRGRDKPKKVALVAAMDRSLFLLDAVIRDQTPWQQSFVPTTIEV